MKKLTSLGCLLALVFAGASAFATTWFGNVVSATLDNKWTNTEGWSWDSVAGTGALTNWNATAPLKYTPVSQTGKDEAISTEVKFSVMDYEDLTGEGAVNISDVKGGLTVAQPEGGVAAYYGVAQVGSTKGWVALTGTPSDGYVKVTVEFFEKGGSTFVNYKVGDTLLALASDTTTTNIPVTIDNTQITSIEYLGQCNIKTLAGMMWNSDPKVPEEIVITGGPAGGMKYNHSELMEYIGADANDDAKVKAFFEKECANGLKGWVNYSLGLAETDVFGVESNKVVQGEVTLDFGFAVAEGHTVTYKMDDAKVAANSATVSTAGQTKEQNTQIHTVAVIVDGIQVGTETFGVMDTGKETLGKVKGDKTFDIVAVPWESFGGGKVTVANLLNTAELTEHDKLYIYNAAGFYDTYELKSGAWDPIKVTVLDNAAGAGYETPAPENMLLEQGTAIWIERDVASRLIFAGKLAMDNQVEKENIATAAKAKIENEKVIPEWTLIANPTVNALKLSAISAHNGDKIVVEDVNDPREYVFNGSTWSYTIWTEKDGVRGRKIKVAETVTDPGTFAIPAGVGFWYVNTGTEAVTINFGTNVPVSND